MTATMYAAPTYECDAYPQLSHSRCTCGRVARECVADKKTRGDKWICRVCSTFYDRLWEDQEKKIRWGELDPSRRKKAGRPPVARR